MNPFLPRLGLEKIDHHLTYTGKDAPNILLKHTYEQYTDNLLSTKKKSLTPLFDHQMCPLSNLKTIYLIVAFYFHTLYAYSHLWTILNHPYYVIIVNILCMTML